MKRYLALILLLALFVPVIAGCAKNEDETSNNRSAAWNAAHLQSEYFNSEIIEEGNAYYIVRDKDTNVMYLIATGYHASVMTPIYNSNGTIKTYQEETTNET